jgi:hypothetical protein
MTIPIKEYLEEKYPYQDMNIVVESFDVKLACDISRQESHTAAPTSKLMPISIF